MNKNDNKNPFKVPKNYLDSFEDNLMDKLSEEEFNIPKKQDFSVPEGYFDILERDINKKLDAEVKVVPLNTYRKYLAAVASMAAIMLVTLGIYWNRTEQLSFAGLANSDIETYFENNTYGLSSYEIADVIQFNDTQILYITDNQIEEENILEYLTDTIDDFEELNIDYNE